MSRLAWSALVALSLAAPAAAMDPRLPLLGEEPTAAEKAAAFARSRADDPALAAALAAADALPARDRISAALRATHPEYARALARWERSGDNAEDWRALLTSLPAGERFLRAHASYFLGRALLARDDLAGAAEALEAVRGRLRLGTAWTDEATLYLAFAYARQPDVGGTQASASALRAARLLEQLIPPGTRGGAGARYPDAPERVVEGARWLLRELNGEGLGPLLELAQRMETIERLLRRTRTDDITQGKQQEVVQILERLIELMREKEEGGGGQGGGGQKQGRQQGGGRSGSPSGNQRSGSPAAESNLPGGDGQTGDLAEGQGRAVSDEWGTLQEREREEAVQFLRERFPTRYREIIERYYRAIAEEDR